MKKITIIILTLVFLQACGDATLTPDNTPKVIMPLKAGNYWLFVSRIFDINQIDTTRWECLKDTTYNGKQSWLIKSLSINDTSWKTNKPYYKGVGIMRFDSNGIWTIGYASVFKDFLIFKYPVKLGDKYESFEETVEVMNVDTTMILYNKTYKNVVIYKASEPQINGSFNYFYKRYVCPGIGLIKLEQYLVGTQSFPQRLIAAEELFEYKIY